MVLAAGVRLLLLQGRVQRLLWREPRRPGLLRHPGIARLTSLSQLRQAAAPVPAQPVCAGAALLLCGHAGGRGLLQTQLSRGAAQVAPRLVRLLLWLLCRPRRRLCALQTSIGTRQQHLGGRPWKLLLQREQVLRQVGLLLSLLLLLRQPQGPCCGRHNARWRHLHVPGLLPGSTRDVDLVVGLAVPLAGRGSSRYPLMHDHALNGGRRLADHSIVCWAEGQVAA